MFSGFDNLIETMRLFRRKQHGPSSGAAAPQPEKASVRTARPSGRGAARDDHDWRSYDLIAQDYARTLAPAMAVPAGDLVDLVQVGPGARVLDLGTGSGVAARAAWAKAGGQGLVVGVDPSTEMLLAARREGGGSHYASATAIDLPFRDATFTHVVANFVIAHFPKYETALFDVLRVLRPGGRMGVTTWGPSDDRDEFRTAWRSVAEEYADAGILSDAIRRVVPWEELFSDRNKLKEVLHDAGLRDIWVEQRDYRFEMTVDDYLTGRETAATGRFLRQMLGEDMWGIFRRRTRQIFAERFPPRINDFREVILAVGHKA
jgi:ubiquinone/menaquinone biosynthesis C-methylase UbiE